MKFNEMGLSQSLLDSLHAMGFSDPTPIQEQAIPLLLQGKDLIGQAQTGTGKTAAFGLPILENWLQAKKGMHNSNVPHGAHLSAPAPSYLPGTHVSAHTSRSGSTYHSRAPVAYTPTVASPTALILVPTRELAAQVHVSLQAMAKHSGARIVPIYGGQEMRKQLRLFRSPVDVLVGTPGRTLDHLRQGSLKLDCVRTVVLDEADRMLDMGFIHDVVKLLDATPRSRQTLLFSATIPREITSIAHKHMKNPETIKVSEDELTVERIKQLYVRVNTANRFGMLLSALRTLKPFLSLVFTRTKHDAKRLAKQLSFNGVSADAMHGNLRQNARERTMAAFRNGDIDVLVATDLASRGIDVREITHVFNYDLPADPMTYVHRIGRTARAGADGVAISLVSGDPRRAVEIIERATGSKMEELVLTPEQAMMPHPDARPSNGPGRGRSSSHSSSRGHSSSSHPREHSEYRGHGEGRSNEERSSHRQGRSESHSSRSSGHSGERSEGGHSAHPDGPRRPTHHSSHKRY